MKGHSIIDGDAHIRETEEDYTSRMEPEHTRLHFSLFLSDNWDGKGCGCDQGVHRCRSGRPSSGGTRS
jgi:hypothetical protein